MHRLERLLSDFHFGSVSDVLSGMDIPTRAVAV